MVPSVSSHDYLVSVTFSSFYKDTSHRGQRGSISLEYDLIITNNSISKKLHFEVVDFLGDTIQFVTSLINKTAETRKQMAIPCLHIVQLMSLKCNWSSSMSNALSQTKADSSEIRFRFLLHSLFKAQLREHFIRNTSPLALRAQTKSPGSMKIVCIILLNGPNNLMNSYFLPVMSQHLHVNEFSTTSFLLKTLFRSLLSNSQQCLL